MISQTDKKIVNDLVVNNIEFATSVPCKQLAGVIEELELCNDLMHVPCNREDEGMGLCAGAYMGGKRSAIFMQNTALGVCVQYSLDTHSVLPDPIAHDHQLSW